VACGMVAEGVVGLAVVLRLLLVANTTTAMVSPRMTAIAIASSARRCW